MMMLTRDDVDRALGKLAVMLPHTKQAALIRDPNRTSELEVVIAGYYEHLQRYPAEALEYATQRVIRDSEWFPTVSRLVAACEAEMEHGPGVLARFEQVGIVREIPAPVSLALLEEGEA